MPSTGGVREFLGLRRSILGVLAMAILVGMGEHMAERFLPIYIIALGGGTIVIGLLNALDNLLSALYAFPGGYLSDHWGEKRALFFFNLIAIVGYVIVILIPRWEAVLVGALFFLSWSAISLPATMGIVSKVLPKDKRTMGVSMHSIVRRIPMSLGPIVGGVFIGIWGETTGVRAAFGFAIVMALVALALQQRLIEDHPRSVSKAEGNPLRLWGEMTPELRRLLVADILVRFCEQIPYAFVVVWCMKTIATPVTALQFGVLTAIEMTTAILIYIPVAHFADRSHKKPFVVMTFGFFTVFPMILWFSHSFWPLVGAFVVRGFKEFGEPTRKALIMDLAPEGKKAGMFGLYYLIRDTIVAVAALGGAFLWQMGPEVNFMTATAFGLLGTVWFALRGADLGRTAEGA
jgi:MFS family permease